jgi:type II secretory pathway pseudopilin PulG
MKTKQLRQPASHSKGITLIEILLVIGLLVVLLSFAMPSVSGAAIKAEMTSTLENVDYSLQMARKVARATESRVVMNISAAQPDTAQVISFTSPGKNGAANPIQIQDFSLPDDVVLISDHDSFVFDGRGLVENPGRVILVSRVDEAVTTTINVQ